MKNTSWFFVIAAALALMLATLACGGGARSSPTPPPPTQQDTPTAAPPTKAAQPTKTPLPTKAASPTKAKPTPTTASGGTTAQFYDLVFASQVISDADGLRAVDPGDYFADISEINAVWEYENTEDGADFQRVWQIDGETVLDRTSPWDGGESGTYHLSLFVDSGTLDPGLYTLELYYAGELLTTGEVEIGSGAGLGDAVYADDFEDDSSGWSTYDDAEATVAYEDGQLVFTIQEMDWLAWSNAGSEGWADVTIEVDAAFDSGPAGGEAGIICRCTGDCASQDSFYYFILGDDGSARITKVEEGEQTKLASKTRAAVSSTGVNHLKAVCSGSTLQFYVNDKLAVEAEDDSIISGDVGLIAGTPEDASGLKIAFDDFLVLPAAY